jgi:polyhydroxybutyrate depolymerase
MAFPSGSAASWNIGPCCVDNVDDVAFTRAMVEDIREMACIDPSRIYATGVSMGGGMAHHLACQASDLFAAVAPFSFDLIEETVEYCTPIRPITVVTFRGTLDPLVPYEGGYSHVILGHPITFLGAVKTFKEWAAINGCVGDASDAGNGCQEYTACEEDVEVRLCTEEGGGVVPGDATIAWPILKRHLLP